MKKASYLLLFSLLAAYLLFTDSPEGEVEKLYVFYSSGELKEVTTIDYNGRPKHTTVYFKNSARKIEIPYKHGRINGVVEFYYPGGSLQRIAEVSDGKYNGLFREYTLDGIVNKEIIYKDGTFVESVAFDVYGEKIIQQSFLENGLCIIKDEEGEEIYRGKPDERKYCN